MDPVTGLSRAMSSPASATSSRSLSCCIQNRSRSMSLCRHRAVQGRRRPSLSVTQRRHRLRVRDQHGLPPTDLCQLLRDLGKPATCPCAHSVIKGTETCQDAMCARHQASGALRASGSLAPFSNCRIRLDTADSKTRIQRAATERHSRRAVVSNRRRADVRAISGDNPEDRKRGCLVALSSRAGHIVCRANSRAGNGRHDQAERHFRGDVHADG